MEIVLIVAVIFFIIGYFFGKAKVKYEENIGEQVVNSILNKYFGTEEYHLMKNVTLPIAGGTTQIDHVFVCIRAAQLCAKRGVACLVILSLIGET